MDSTVHRRVSGTPIPDRLTPSSPPLPMRPSQADHHPAFPHPCGRARTLPARRVRRARSVPVRIRAPAQTPPAVTHATAPVEVL